MWKLQASGLGVQIHPKWMRNPGKNCSYEPILGILGKMKFLLDTAYPACKNLCRFKPAGSNLLKILVGKKGKARNKEYLLLRLGEK